MGELRWILLAAGALLLLAIYAWGWQRQRAKKRRATAPSEERSAAPLPVAPAPAPAGPSGSTAGTPEGGPAASSPVSAAALPPRREPTIGGARVPVVEEFELPSIATERRGAARRAGTGDTSTAGAAEQSAPSRSAPTPPARPQKILTVRVTAPAPARFEGAALLSAITGLGLVHGRYEIFHRLDAQGRPVFSIANLLEPGTFDPETMASGAYPGVAFFAVLPGPVPGHHALDDLMATARSLADRLGGNLLDDRGAMLSVQRMAQMREEVTAFERQLAAGRSG